MSSTGVFSFWAVADFFFYCFLSLFCEAAAAAKIGEISCVGEFYMKMQENAGTCMKMQEHARTCMNMHENA